MPFNIGPGELILILIIALVVLGPARLPDVAQSLGKSLREFRKAASDISDAGKVDVSTEPTTGQMAPPTPAPAPALGVPVPHVTPDAQTAVPAPSAPVPPAPSEAMAPPSNGDAPEATAEPATGADRDSTAG
jgi:TatA/E family protein of Tat protein translocase